MQLVDLVLNPIDNFEDFIEFDHHVVLPGHHQSQLSKLDVTSRGYMFAVEVIEEIVAQDMHTL